MTRHVAIAASLAALVGCGQPAVAVAQPREPSGARDAGPDASAPSGTDARDEDFGADACTRCHASVVHAWRGSLHAQAAVDPIFVAEHAVRHDAWCLTCHDPRGGGRGVDCAVCHVQNGHVVSTVASGRAPHAVVADAAMGTESACVTCHDFDFPRVARQPMQNTVDEWRASAAGERGVRCQECHMARARNLHDHGTPGRLDPALAARALGVTARAWLAGETTRVELVLTSRAGHAVPTGDLYRRLVVSASADGVEETRELRRRFTNERGQLREVADGRVPARGARRVTIALAVRASRVSWSIELRAVDDARAEELDLPDEAWRTLLAAGELAVAPRR